MKNILAIRSVESIKGCTVVDRKPVLLHTRWTFQRVKASRGNWLKDAQLYGGAFGVMRNAFRRWSLSWKMWLVFALRGGFIQPRCVEGLAQGGKGLTFICHRWRRFFARKITHHTPLLRPAYVYFLPPHNIYSSLHVTAITPRLHSWQAMRVPRRDVFVSWKPCLIMLLFARDTSQWTSWGYTEMQMTCITLAWIVFHTWEGFYCLSSPCRQTIQRTYLFII